jgi:hypothetical protein
MSHAARNWAKAQTVGNGVAKAVLLELADCANERGECWPGLPAICRVIEHCDEAVRVAVKLLIKRKLIEKEPRTTPGGKMLSPLWRLKMDAEAAGGDPKRGNGLDVSPPEYRRAKPAPQKPPAPQNSGGLAPQISGGVAPQISGGNPSLDTSRKILPSSTHTDPVPSPARVRVCEEEDDQSISGKVIQMPPPVSGYPRRALPLAREPDPPGFEDAWHRLYPANRGSYGLAKAAWKSVLASGAATVAELHDGIRCFPFILEEGNRYVMSMDKWLHGENWRPRPGSVSALVAAAGELESLLAQSLAEQRAAAKQ